MNTDQYTGFNRHMEKYARRLRLRMTKQEKRIWYDFLRKYPIKIYRQRSIGRYIVDFYCSRAHLVIEIDGSQHYTKEGLVYDEKRTAALETYKLKVIRFSNREIDEQFERVCWEIDQVIKAQIAQSESFEDKH